MGSGTLGPSPPLNDRPSINVRRHCNVCSHIGVAGKFRNFISQFSLNLAHISRKRRVVTCATDGRSTGSRAKLGDGCCAVLCVYERERGSGRIGHEDQCTKPIVLQRRILTKRNEKSLSTLSGTLDEKLNTAFSVPFIQVQR